MKAWRRLWHRLLALRDRRRLERDLADEFGAHIEMQTEDNVRAGMSPTEARRLAVLKFGAMESLKERYRDQRRLPLLDVLAHDVKFGARALWRDRWVALAAVLVLALGIGANSLVFAIVNGVLIRELPFESPERLVAIGTRLVTPRPLEAGMSYPDILDWRGADSFEGIAAAVEMPTNLSDDAAPPERTIGAYVSWDAFSLLGQQPLLGRAFSADDDRPGAAPVVILAESLWRSRYRADPGIVGRTIRADGTPALVVGVMPAGFGFPARSRAWQPLAAMPEAIRGARDERDLSAFGRLADGASLEQARAELAGIAGALAQRYPETNTGVEPTLVPYREALVGGRVRSVLPVLMGVVAFVLLIACANVANLLLARASVRGREIAMRMALGARRGQVIRQLLVESVLLAALGGIGGFLLSLAAIRLVWNRLDVGIGLPYWIGFTIDARVLGFLALVCLGTALLFGLAPALQASGARFTGALSETGRNLTHGRAQQRWIGGLVVFQLALTPMLLTGGGLMLRSVMAIIDANPGIEITSLVRGRLDITGEVYADSESQLPFYRALDDRLAGLSGVEATLTSHLPFGGGLLRNLEKDDDPAASEPLRPPVRLVTIGPRYFDTIGAPLLRGTDLPGLGAAGEPVAIVNAQVAEDVFPGIDPTGRSIRLTPLVGPAGGPEWFTIVGIAPNIRQRDQDDNGSVDAVVYVSYASNPQPYVTILTQSTLDAGAIAPLLRAQVEAIDSSLAVFDTMSMEDVLATSDAQVGGTVFGGMFVVVALVALLLATIGLYAMTAYSTAQRTREIGVRGALGAKTREIWWQVVGRASRHVGMGLALGLVGSIGLMRLLGDAIVGVPEGLLDPWTTGGIIVLLIGTSLAACHGPAKAAMRVDPLVALRHE